MRSEICFDVRSIILMLGVERVYIISLLITVLGLEEIEFVISSWMLLPCSRDICFWLSV